MPSAIKEITDLNMPQEWRSQERPGLLCMFGARGRSGAGTHAFGTVHGQLHATIFLTSSTEANLS